MHAQVIDAELAHKMYAAGFKTIRISLETSDVVRQKLTGPKVTNNGFTRAVERLKAAGFTAEDIGVYLLMGLPGQPLKEVVESIQVCARTRGSGETCRVHTYPRHPRMGKSG